MTGVYDIAGIDGCRAGWCVAQSDSAQARFDFFIAATIDEAVSRLQNCRVIGIDIPIGLPDAGGRACDRLARRRLAPQRSSSVFSAPIRPILDVSDFRNACDISERVDGRRISIQTFNILPKIREVDVFLRSRLPDDQRLFEVHPELAFARLNDDQALSEAKRSRAGFEARRALLNGSISSAVVQDVLEALPRSQVARDDVLDACAVLLSAARIAAGTARRLPAEPDFDATGIDMAIWS